MQSPPGFITRDSPAFMAIVERNGWRHAQVGAVAAQQEPADEQRRERASAPQGSMIRPGAIMAPDCVWHVLQSPEVCFATMARSRPMYVTFTVYGVAITP